MKRMTTLVFLALLALILAACGGTSAAPAAASASAGAAPVATASASRLATSYEGALPQRNQLLLGTLRLEDGNSAVTTEQAAKLLPLWQGVRATMNSGAASEAETDALLAQIEAVLTADQIAAIGELQVDPTQAAGMGQEPGAVRGHGRGRRDGWRQRPVAVS